MNIVCSLLVLFYTKSYDCAGSGFPVKVKNKMTFRSFESFFTFQCIKADIITAQDVLFIFKRVM